MTEDRLSELPVELMYMVMRCLPLQDAAKSTVLSRKWFNAWKGFPCLRFDAVFFSKVLKSDLPEAHKFLNILSVILLSHIGPINTFYLYVPKLEPTSTVSTLDLGPWISFLSINSVKEMTIINGQDSPLKLPYHLFNCLGMEMLKLEYCVINLLPSFKIFKSLRCMVLEGVIFMGNSFSDFLLSCPILESLTLKKCTGFDYICINAPNLRYLTVSGEFKSVSVRSVTNLLAFSITLDKMVKNYHSDRTCELITYLAKSSKIEQLRFGGYFCKFLAAGRISRVLPTCFYFLKALELSNIESNVIDELHCLIEVIRSCPNVEELDLSFSSTDSAEHKITFDPRYRLTRLRKARVTSVMGVNIECKLIEILLSCSPALETLHIKQHEKITDFLKSKLIQELIYFRRASPKAVIIVDPQV